MFTTLKILQQGQNYLFLFLDYFAVLNENTNSFPHRVHVCKCEKANQQQLSSTGNVSNGFSFG